MRITQNRGTNWIIAAAAPVKFSVTFVGPAIEVETKFVIVGVNASPTTRINKSAMIPLMSFLVGSDIF